MHDGRMRALLPGIDEPAIKLCAREKWMHHTALGSGMCGLNRSIQVAPFRTIGLQIACIKKRLVRVGICEINIAPGQACQITYKALYM